MPDRDRRTGKDSGGQPGCGHTLFAPRGRIDGALLEELFSPVARDAVIEWRDRFHSLCRAYAHEKELLPPAFEAELERGGIVRMHLRGEITGMGGNGAEVAHSD